MHGSTQWYAAVGSLRNSICICCRAQSLQVVRHSSTPGPSRRRKAAKRQFGDDGGGDGGDVDGAPEATATKRSMIRRPALSYVGLRVGLRVDAQWIVSGRAAKKHGATVHHLNPDSTGLDENADIQ